MSGILILDFDGTLTDPEKEAISFNEEYLRDLSEATGITLEEVKAMTKHFELELLKNSTKNGWERNGRIVAPATVDPYIRIGQTSTKILKEIGIDHPDFVPRFLDLLFRYNYPKAEIVFKDGARELLASLQGSEVFIVTNSRTDPVKNKIRVLGGGGEDETNPFKWIFPRIFGNAKKFIIYPEFKEVARSFQIPGLNRPIFLRRQKYFEILDSIRQEHHAKWSDLTVVGDIFELDLALPLYLGAEVALVTNEYSLDYEIKYLKEHPKGHIITDLSQIYQLAA